MLQYDNASCVFPNGRGVAAATFAVPDGRIVGFVGRNGAGKTTSMRLAMRLLQPTGGEVRWDGSPLGPGVVKGFGYMPEERGLYPRMRVDEQLDYLGELRGLSRADARRDRRRWAEALGFADKAKERLQTLSLGNQQRVQLASAFLGSPRALILDEPFSGLDPVAVQTLSEHIRDFRANGAAILVSSHQLSLLEGLCDEAVIISDGAIVAAGAMADILEDTDGAFTVEFAMGTPPWLRRPAEVEATENELVYRVTPSASLPLSVIVSEASTHGQIRAVSKVRRSLADVLVASQSPDVAPVVSGGSR